MYFKSASFHLYLLFVYKSAVNCVDCVWILHLLFWRERLCSSWRHVFMVNILYHPALRWVILPPGFVHYGYCLLLLAQESSRWLIWPTGRHGKYCIYCSIQPWDVYRMHKVRRRVYRPQRYENYQPAMWSFLPLRVPTDSSWRKRIHMPRMQQRFWLEPPRQPIYRQLKYLVLFKLYLF